MKINVKNPNTESEINNVTIRQFIHILLNPLDDECFGAQFLYDLDELEYEIIEDKKIILEQQNKLN
jgi:hypothetical protein